MSDEKGMNELLQAIQARLAGQVTDFGGDKAIHFVAVEDALPASTPFPCAALKDGTILTDYSSGSRTTFTVDIIIYVQINTLYGFIIGKGNQKGIHQMEEASRKCLEKWDPDGFLWEPGITRNPSMPGTFGAVAVQKKKFTMRWVAA